MLCGAQGITDAKEETISCHVVVGNGGEGYTGVVAKSMAIM
jgi:hypothetical protein